MKYTFLAFFLATFSIKTTNGLDILSILKHFRISFDDNLLTIKPLPNIEHQIEIQNGYLNGIKNGTVPRNTITGFHYTEIITTDNINAVTNQRTIKFETVTCTQLSPMLGRYILQEILQALGFEPEEIKNYDVCAFRISVKETGEVYTVKFSRGVLEAKFNLGVMDTVGARYINENVADAKGNFGFKLKIKMSDGEIELVGTDVNGDQYIKIRPEQVIEDSMQIWKQMVEISSGVNGVSDILRLGIYFDKVLESWEFVSGVDIVKADVLRIMDSLWDSGVDLIGHFMEKGRKLFLENVESLFDEGKVIKTIRDYARLPIQD